MNINPGWTAERIEILQNMRAEGHSFSRVAAVLGISPNAAIGKANRLGLPRKTRSGPPRSARPRKPKSASAPSRPVRDDMAKAGLRSVASDNRLKPCAAHPPAQATVQAVTKLPSGAASSAASEGLLAQDSRILNDNTQPSAPLPAIKGVPLENVGAKQCRFPLWPHYGGVGPSQYGMLCGAPIEAPSHATEPGAKARPSETPHYCAHHKHVCAARPPETRKADRQAEHATSVARHRGVA